MIDRKASGRSSSGSLPADHLVTIKDLEEFKQDILQEINKLLKHGRQDTTKKWLKSREVRKLLDISPGKLHQLRANRQLGFMRIGGAIYYDYVDIEKMFECFKTPMSK
ncbi:helix-turn-helix domain-containing protein [Dyadobacter aurulentus]|uniref:helix-turn-helix domain-containing protein n=1 Tax=Dyadobacter sp. UC 10 TaxID=2605428 RepID=UPI0011F306C0|nr:helix-turn-helix domain-containing protein [Dyadobacter sp. UC 10]KAA0993423.1 helix-turn-helix domain-containing protein [Dyadobacter sp. UC 10]